MGNVIINAGIHALAIGAIAAGLSFGFSFIHGQNWRIRDTFFIAAVCVVVFWNRWYSGKHDDLLQQHQIKKLQTSHSLKEVDKFHGPEVHLSSTKCTCLLFFGSWCPKSRAALIEFEKLCEEFAPQNIQFLALTQESHEELQAYHKKGTEASNFRLLQTFHFSIGIEQGSMAKEYLIKHEVSNLPCMFVLSKDTYVEWYGELNISNTEEVRQNILSITKKLIFAESNGAEKHLA